VREEVSVPRSAKETNSKSGDVSRSDFLRTELERLGFGETPNVAPELADADDLMVVAFEEELEPELLDALLWVVQRFPVDWGLQYDLAISLGYQHRVNQVLSTLRERKLTIFQSQRPMLAGQRVDLVAELEAGGNTASE
jgi:hypothetical protein